MTVRPTEVLEFWFGQPDAHGLADSTHRGRWFNASPEFDARVDAQFGPAVTAALGGAFESWTARPDGTLALILLLDQFTRNIHRGTAAAWSGDARALALARRLVERGADLKLRGDARSFAYLPFEHAESRTMQALHLGLLARWQNEAVAPVAERLTTNIEFARRHAAIVQRFGRFPHRNSVLGRASTAAEIEFLERARNRFGQ